MSTNNSLNDKDNEKMAPIPVRFKKDEVDLVLQLQELTNLSRSDLVRRACRYTFPRFLQGKVDILTLKDFDKGVGFETVQD
jgi:hypothetical protein